ncbi:MULTISPECIES: hypothetical protein [Deinococcus]|uniref:hypothetical protein n=1 Tax=Deinococcus TaxID=1298 RepID=UPI001404E425|nr:MULTISPECIES: hypothetical protein [Deinococcus]
MSHKDRYNEGERDHSPKPGNHHRPDADKNGDGRHNGSESGGGKDGGKQSGSSGNRQS